MKTQSCSPQFILPEQKKRTTKVCAWIPVFTGPLRTNQKKAYPFQDTPRLKKQHPVTIGMPLLSSGNVDFFHFIFFRFLFFRKNNLQHPVFLRSGDIIRIDTFGNRKTP